MDYAALKAELAKPAYAGMTDAEAAVAINAATVVVKRPVQSADARRYLMLVGKWPTIAALARGLIAGTDGEKLAAVALVEALTLKETFNLSVPAYLTAVQAQLGACEAAGLIDAADTAGILDFANVSVPLLPTIGCGEIQDVDVSTIVWHIKVARAVTA